MGDWSVNDEASQAIYGFLRVLGPDDSPRGGYLAVRANGFPEECWYTEPVQVSRSHRLMYGTALRPYLCGSVVAGELLSKKQKAPQAVFVDQPEVAAGLNTPDVVVVFVGNAEQAPAGWVQVADSASGEGRPWFCAQRDAGTASGMRDMMGRLDVEEVFGRITGILEDLAAGGDT